MFATINIHKPKGLTSHDVVARLRRIFNLKKVGHMGTLDPLAEGVLPICLGQATRLIEYFPTGKRYTAEITLGKTSTTLDSEGEILTDVDCQVYPITEERIQQVLEEFKGTIQQQVPLYSAVHVGGKKLYEIARKHEKSEQPKPDIELPTREITIYALQLLKLDVSDPAHPVIQLDVTCSSGTYIRSLARDIGKTLDCGALLSGLLRTEHGHFKLADSVTLETLQTSEQPQAFLLNPLPFLEIPTLPIHSEQDAKLLLNGMKITPDADMKLKPNAQYVTTYADKPLGVVEVQTGKLKPLKIFPASD